MVHFHEGTEFRGVSLFQYHFVEKNPRYGFRHDEPIRDPAAVDKSQQPKNFFGKIADKFKKKKNTKNG